MDSMISQLCPVCGYELGFPPWKGESASDEISPCCFIQFGYDDWAKGRPEFRKEIYDAWRKNWISEGLKWRGKGQKPPHGWNPIQQLATIGTAKGENNRTRQI